MLINIRNQRGITFISLLLLLMIMGFFLLLLFKLGPVYLENYTVKTVLSNLRKDPMLHTRPSRAIRGAIDSQLYVNEVRRLGLKDIKLKREGSVVIINIDYFVRVPIIANVDAIMTFKEAARLDGT